jgi:hypothetical protein
VLLLPPQLRGQPLICDHLGDQAAHHRLRRANHLGKIGVPEERKVSEVTIRQYVRERKRELGWSARATCVPQSYAPGQEGQVYWYEAWAELNGERIKLQVFAMRYGERIEPPVRELPDEQNQALRGLWVRREQLIEMLVMEENRLENAPKALHRSLRAHIDYLRKQIKQADNDLTRG